MMGIRSRLLQLSNRTAFQLFNRFDLEYAPAHLNGSLVTLPLDTWQRFGGFHIAYEPYMARLLKRYLQSGAVFYDVGSHVGLWSCYAAGLVGPSGLVVACEPSISYQAIVKAAKRYPQLRPLNVGAGSENQEIPFYGQGTSTSGSFVHDVTKINEGFSTVPIESYLVSIKTLDTLVGEQGRVPTLVKIDVEGFELEVLKGASRLLAEHRPTFLIEIHPPQLALSEGSEPEIFERLAKARYTTEVVDRNPNSLYTILATPGTPSRS